MYAVIRRLKRRRADDRWKVRHLDNIELVREVLAVQLRARWLVFPNDVVSNIFILPLMRKVFFQQLQLAHDRSASSAIDRGVLRANRDADRFRARSNHEQRSRETGREQKLFPGDHKR